MIALIAALGASFFLALTLVRVFIGPTLYDRALAANLVVLVSAVVCAGLAAAAGNAMWLDAALALVACAFVLNLASLKFFRAGTFQAPLVRESEERP